MRKFEGLSASRGIVVGPVFCLADETPVTISRYPIGANDAEKHWLRFETALVQAKNELCLLRDDGNKEQSQILEAHLMMLSDPEFIPQIKTALFTRLFNIESVLADKVAEAAGMLRATGDTYLSERAVDIEDAFDRVAGHLLPESAAKGKTGQKTRFVPQGSVLAARNLKPSETLALKDSGIVGIVLEEGGATSHVAILARSWHLPAVMGVRGLLDGLADGQEIILDAIDGLVIVDAPSETVAAYRSRWRSDLRLQAESAVGRSALVDARCETTDGTVLTLRANIALAGEASSALEEGAEGVGLFRSEFLFLGADESPDEETQFAAYRTAVELMAGAPVIIRTLDAGADKMVGEQLDLAEKNPLLGWRAVRYCLDRLDLFRTQLRALLRASAFGDLRIMFPMISNLEELDAVLEVLAECRAECLRDGLPFRTELKVGIMIEVPSAAVCADLLAAKSDFMSIGTNDLIQYTMAVDRENPKVSRLYDCYNPAVLRLIAQTIEAGNKTRTEVSMCGEMAGDPAAVFLLAGMGLRSFSMAPTLITQVKEFIRKVSIGDAESLAHAALELSTARDIRKLVQERIKAYE